MKTLIPVLLISVIIATSSPAADHLWRWVDEDGVLTFSNTRPPASARDVVPIYSRYAEDADRLKSEAQDANHQPREASTNRWRTDPQANPGTMGQETLFSDQTQFDDPYRADEDDCCGQYVDSIPYDRLYAPYIDYAYSRRYYKGSRRYAQRHYAGRSLYRHPYRQYRKRHHFGYRRYDRHYYHNSYRYRSNLPRYHHYGKKAYSRGYHGKKFHRGGYYGKRPAGLYDRDRGYRGGKTRRGHAGYRRGSGNRMRR